MSHLILTVGNSDLTGCMWLCDSMIEPECKSFVYNESTNICKIYNVELQSYIEECGMFGAGNDTFYNCLTDDTTYPDPCKVNLFSSSIDTITYEEGFVLVNLWI